MAKKSTAKPKPLTQAEAKPLLGCYRDSSGRSYVAVWDASRKGFALYRAPLTGPGQSPHQTDARDFRRALSFQTFIRESP